MLRGFYRAVRVWVVLYEVLQAFYKGYPMGGFRALAFLGSGAGGKSTGVRMLDVRTVVCERLITRMTVSIVSE